MADHDKRHISRQIRWKTTAFNFPFSKVMWKSSKRSSAVCLRRRNAAPGWRAICGTLLTLGILPVAQAQPTLTTLASFSGQSPGKLTLDDHGNIFGTTWTRGAESGTVYEILKGSQVVTTLASFHGEEVPVGIAVGGSGSIFGATIKRDAPTSGTLFQIVMDSHNVTTLASFHGGLPGGISLDSHGNIFGTTTTIGGKRFNVVELVKGSHTLAVLASSFPAFPRLFSRSQRGATSISSS